MKKYFLHIFSVTACAISFTIAPPAQAGWTCNLFGIGCAQATEEEGNQEKFSKTIDQDHPPEVFAFTLSGTFDKWADIKPQTAVCDTREREDRTCTLSLYIPEIKREAVVVLKPFAHDLGMYKLDSLIANNFGKDPDYRTKEEVYLTAYEAETGVAGFSPFFSGKASITILAERKFRVLIFEGGAYTISKTKNVPVGSISMEFKGVLK